MLSCQQSFRRNNAFFTYMMYFEECNVEECLDVTDIYLPTFFAKTFFATKNPFYRLSESFDADMLTRGIIQIDSQK